MGQILCLRASLAEITATPASARSRAVSFQRRQPGLVDSWRSVVCPLFAESSAVASMGRSLSPIPLPSRALMSYCRISSRRSFRLDSGAKPLIAAQAACAQALLEPCSIEPCASARHGCLHRRHDFTAHSAPSRTTKPTDQRGEPDHFCAGLPEPERIHELQQSLVALFLRLILMSTYVQAGADVNSGFFTNSRI
jgi:hypothetical protein